MRKYEEQPSREAEHKAERARGSNTESKRERQREFMLNKERESARKKRETVGERDNKWSVAPCEGLLRVHSPNLQLRHEGEIRDAAH